MTLALRQLFARWSHEASYPAFSWICILILPVVLNLLIALVEDFRNSLGEYYGIFTLFMMFQLLLGFCCLFLSTMLVTSVGRSELIDQLRLTFTRPREMINALLGQLMLMIVPPALLFMLAVFGWIMFTTGAEDFQRMISFGRALLFLE